MKSFQKINKRTYDLIAEKYKSGHETLEWKSELDKFISYSKTPHPVILDLGSGHGIEAEYIAQALPEARIYAVDISENMLNISPKNSAVTYVHDDMVTYQPVQKVDGVWARGSIHHLTLEEMNELFQNISKHLKIGGIVGMINKCGKSEEIEEKDKYGQRIKRYFQYVNEDLVEAITKPHGFSLIEQYHVHNDHEWLVSFLEKSR